MNVVLLTGLPGSGKSTYCQDSYPDYIRINQDVLGSRGACLDLMKKSLEDGKDIVVDRTNISKKQRKYFIDLALQYGAKSISGVYLEVDPQECVARIHLRQNHPTISEEMTLEKKWEIVTKFQQEFELLELSEGFNQILFKRN